MICYYCNKIKGCLAFRYSMSNDFSIGNCKNYEEASQYKYRHIAEHDDLMQLIYDYFTEQIEDGCSYEEAKEAITRAMWNL